MQEIYTYIHFSKYFPGSIYLFKFNNGNTRKRSEICSQLTMKTPDVVLVFLLLTFRLYFTLFSRVSVVDFEQVNFSWIDFAEEIPQSNTFKINGRKSSPRKKNGCSHNSDKLKLRITKEFK